MRLFICIAIFLTFVACSSNSDQPEKKDASVKVPVLKTDTSVVWKDLYGTFSIRGFEQKMFFLMFNNDTAKYCYRVSKELTSGRIGMKYVSSRYLHLPLLTYDTSAIFSGNTNQRASNPTMTKALFIRELSLIIKSMAKEYDLSNLHSLILPISTIERLPEYIYKQHKKRHRKNINPSSNFEISRIVYTSDITKQIAEIVDPYNIAVDRVSIDGLIEISSSNSSTKRKGAAPDNYTWDGVIIFTFKDKESVHY